MFEKLGARKDVGTKNDEHTSLAAFFVVACVREFVGEVGDVLVERGRVETFRAMPTTKVHDETFA